jgi:hypothetical protein
MSMNKTASIKVDAKKPVTESGEPDGLPSHHYFGLLFAAVAPLPALTGMRFSGKSPGSSSDKTTKSV